MTSEEALDELEWFINCVYDSVEDGHAVYLKDEVELASNAYNKIEKDLKVLDILKKHSTRLDDADWDSNIFNGIDYEYLDEEERKVIKEWLDDDK